jgi:hypothetical protein
MDRIKVLLDRILDRSKVDAEIAPISILMGMVSEDIHRTMDTAEIVARHIESLNDMVE